MECTFVQSEANGGSKSVGMLSKECRKDGTKVNDDTVGAVDLSAPGVTTGARVLDDGRVSIQISDKREALSTALDRIEDGIEASDAESLQVVNYQLIPRLDIVLQVVGSMGDIQPFISLGKVLKSKYGHRIRVATHLVFRDLVEDHGLEFFNIGGDPQKLMAYMVKNPALIPTRKALMTDEVAKRRAEIFEIMNGCWRSCFQLGDGTTRPNIADLGNSGQRPFVANMIIANPPSFAHVHIAERLGIPLHLMFTMPWSPSGEFPHPLAAMTKSNIESKKSNLLSYTLIHILTCQGLGDVINRFRTKVLGLDPISKIWAPGLISRLRIPITYCWSPALLPKPRDWGRYIRISGYCFLKEKEQYTPPPALVDFLESGPPPIYVGFGSIVVGDPEALTAIILEAVAMSGQRAVLSRGWSSLGATDVPNDVYVTGDIPHEWLFNRVSCVVHHGGAGTTATGLAHGKPTVVVPFFGDQPFWGAMVCRVGAGPYPIPIKRLTAKRLADAIQSALKPQIRLRAMQIAREIEHELGDESAAKAFHDYLDYNRLRCPLIPEKPAVWRIKHSDIQLSGLAAAILVDANLLASDKLELYRPVQHDTEDRPWEPFVGGASALVGSLAAVTLSLLEAPRGIAHRRNKDQKKDAHFEKDHGLDRNGASSDLTEIVATFRRNSTTPHKRSWSFSFSSSQPSRHSIESAKEGETCVRKELSGFSATTQKRIAIFRRKTSPAPGLLSKHRPVNTMGWGLDPSQFALGSVDQSESTETVDDEYYAPHCQFHEMVSSQVKHSHGGISTAVRSALKFPMDFAMSVTRGFHNVPRALGDVHVGREVPVHGFREGVEEGAKLAMNRLSDAVTGLYTHPRRGWRRNGVAGLSKGLGIGVTGLLFKPGEAVFAIPGYAMMGLYHSVHGGRSHAIEACLGKLRSAEAFIELGNADEQMKHEVKRLWTEMQQDRHHAAREEKPSVCLPKREAGSD